MINFFRSVSFVALSYYLLLPVSNVYALNSAQERLMDISCKWAKKGARNADAASQYLFGMCYYNGVRVEQSYTEAVKLFITAAKAGNQQATDMLSDEYLDNRKTPSEYRDIARNLMADREIKRREIEIDLHRIDQHNDIDAKLRLAEAYFEGTGVEKDQAKAARLYLDSAMQGNTKAQFSIGRMYLHGLGVDKDSAKAYAWLSQISKNNPFAKKSLNQAVRGMSSEELEKAQSLKREYAQYSARKYD